MRIDKNKPFFPVLFKKFLLSGLVVLATFWGGFAESLAKVSYLEDKSKQLRIEDFLSRKDIVFSSSADNSPNLTFTASTLWVRICLPSRSTKPRVLTIENPQLDSLDVFFIHDGNVKRMFQTGDSRPFYTRDLQSNYFSFLVQPGEDTLYLKTSSTGNVSTPLYIHTQEDYFAFQQNNQLVFWFFFGVVFTTLAANLVFYLVLRDKNHLYYSFYVFSNAFYITTSFGLGFQFIWPQHPYLNKFIILFLSSSFFMFFFCDYFLELKDRFKKLHISYWGFMCASIASGLLSLYSFNLGARLITYTLLIFPFFAIFSSLYVYIKTKNTAVILFLAAWFFYLLSIVLYVLGITGIISNNGHLSSFVVIGSAIEMVTLFITVIYKINRIKEENVSHKVQIIDLLQDKEKSLQGQNAILEDKVRERTLQLLEKNDEISSQNEEIVSQNEEMVIQHQELMKQRQELEIQRMELDEVNKAYTEVNKRLNEYKIHLEELVQMRTNELLHANQELAYKNSQLEQYAFMAAHNLRSPIAALLGLSKMVDSETDSEALKEITKRINVSVKKLDIVVKSMSTILNNRNMEEKPLERIRLEKTLSEAIGLLELEIKENNVEISHQFDKCKEIKTIPTYMHNLFFNLISNSIKYKKEGIQPIIHIASEQTDRDYILTFQDNGMGIDLPKYGKDVFKPFKRFHVKTEGSGIGLYLVKTQIESMGGSIEIQSQAGEGSLFIVQLPKPALTEEL